MAQLKWLEQEARRYALPQLVELCRGAHKRLDVIDVMQLLRGSGGGGSARLLAKLLTKLLAKLLAKLLKSLARSLHDPRHDEHEANP